MALADAGYEDDLIARLCLLESHGISDLPREKGIEWLQQELNRACRKARSLTRRVQGEPLSVDDLKLHDMFQPPRQIIEGLLHEGMLLFGGKVKHGKSWLMLDLALSVATGTPVWGHFAVPEPQPVLYISLEDPEGRIKHRLDAIRPGFETNDNLELLCDFPLLNKGGLEKLQGYVQSGRYRLIVVDVLAKIEPASQRGSEKTYLEIYDMFAPTSKAAPRASHVPGDDHAPAQDYCRGHLRHHTRLGGVPGRAGFPVGAGPAKPTKRPASSTLARTTARNRTCACRLSTGTGIFWDMTPISGTHRRVWTSSRF